MELPKVETGVDLLGQLSEDDWREIAAANMQLGGEEEAVALGEVHAGAFAIQHDGRPMTGGCSLHVSHQIVFRHALFRIMEKSGHEIFPCASARIPIEQILEQDVTQIIMRGGVAQNKEISGFLVAMESTRKTGHRRMRTGKRFVKGKRRFYLAIRNFPDFCRKGLRLRQGRRGQFVFDAFAA